MIKYITSVFIVLTVLFEGVQLQNKVQLEIFFEALCPDSYSFITQQLHPNWKEFSPYFDLKLIPFGKSKSSHNGAQFVCQHGPQECKGNRIMSCALKRIPDQNLKVEYTDCFMKLFNLGDSGQECAQKAGININDVQKCYNTKEGTISQLKAEQRTIAVALRFVPTIVYNGVFSQILQDQSFQDFEGVACKVIADIFSQIPKICQKRSAIGL